MKGLFLLPLMLLVMLTGCLGGGDVDRTEWLEKEWTEIEEAARGTEVSFYMYGGFPYTNKWVDTYLAAELKRRYDITLKRVPMNAPVFVNKLLTEKAANKATGTIDLLWINGENFKATREADALFGPFAEKLPNFHKYVDKRLARYDFGFPTDGYEAPYGQAQFVFEYDSAKLKNPPTSFKELARWLKKNPGTFTYPQPPDFTGSAFIRQVFYAVSGGPEQYLDGWNEDLYNKKVPRLWSYLNGIRPYLWQEGKTYPKDSSTLDTIFARGEVLLNMSYHALHAQSMVLEGVYPDTVRTFVMREGSLFNLHFTAIPFNAPNTPGAMVLANFLLSPEAQLSKFDPANWGDFPAIDLNKLSPEWRKKFDDVDLGESSMTPTRVGISSVPEIPAAYLEALEKDWDENVLR